jgi:hypothetical protein
MNKVLVVYYSQSGQLTRIVHCVLQAVEKYENIKIDYEEITPVPEYPFPWGNDFFECFPESVKGIPCKLKPFRFDPSTDYDLVIIALQSWYLSPSIPIYSFLLSYEASLLLKNKKVITLYGVRNMWANSQEIIKMKLKELGAELVGNIVLCDRSNNYIAGITITRWLVNGKKEPTLILPEAGVSKKDIEESSRFGEIIAKSLLSSQFENLHPALMKAGAVTLKYQLICIELTAKKIFNKFADFIFKKGQAGNPSRGLRIKLFKYYLFFVFFVLQPLVSLFFIIKRYILFSAANRKLEYYKDIKLKN